MRNVVSYLLVLLSLLKSSSVQAQCSTCLPNMTCLDFSSLTICPGTLPEQVAGEASFINMSVNIPSIISIADQTYVVESYQIDSFFMDCPGISISPSADGFHTSKSAPEITCFSICGTPLRPGTFFATIPLQLRLNNGIERLDYSMPLFFSLKVLPTRKVNKVFTTTFTSYCDSLVLSSYNNELNDTLFPKTLVWDWKADGIIDDTSNSFLAKTTSPGQHLLQAKLFKFKYRISNVSVNDLAEATWYWHEFCGDGTGFTVFGTPLYTHINDADLSLTLSDNFSVFEGAQVENDDSPQWTLNLPFSPLTDSLKVSFKEVDAAICGDGQNGGSATIPVDREGVYPFRTSGGDGPVSGTITIEKYVDSVITFTDTFNFNPTNLIVELLSDKDTFCNRDSVIVQLNLIPNSNPFQVLWYKNESEWKIDTSSTFASSESSTFSVQVLDSSGCLFTSNTVQLIKAHQDDRLLRVIQVASNQIAITQYPYDGYSVRWFKDGILIKDTMSPIIQNQGMGLYYAELYHLNFPNCFNVSDTLDFIANALDEISTEDILVYPNPSSDVFYVILKNLNQFPAKIVLRNSLGIMVKEWKTDTWNEMETLHISDVPEGTYFIEIIGSKPVIKKMTILR